MAALMAAVCAPQTFADDYEVSAGQTFQASGGFAKVEFTAGSGGETEFSIRPAEEETPSIANPESLMESKAALESVEGLTKDALEGIQPLSLSAPSDEAIFNTQAAPSAMNGANAPKLGGMSEDISAYSGDMTLRFNDISLPGRNGLDLNIGRVYQTNEAAIGTPKAVQLPSPSNGYLQSRLIFDTTNYFNDRYNLGTG
jgi:hypothetical protein